MHYHRSVLLGYVHIHLLLLHVVQSKRTRSNLYISRSPKLFLLIIAELYRLLVNFNEWRPMVDDHLVILRHGPSMDQQ
jgi:hypothetical protein